jgi:WxcM-like, C-terminal
VATSAARATEMKGVKSTHFELHENHGGTLGVIELELMFGFQARRIFFIKANDSATERAMHSVSSAQALMAVSGSCWLDADNGHEKQSLELNGIVFLAAGVWRKLSKFKPNTIIVVAAELCYSDTAYFAEPKPELIGLVPGGYDL